MKIPEMAKKRSGRRPKPPAEVKSVQKIFLITSRADRRYKKSAAAEGFSSTAEWMRHHLDQQSDKTLGEG